MYVVTIQHLNYNEQESKKHNLQFMFHLWPWNKAKVVKSGMDQYNPITVMFMQTLKDLTQAVSKKKWMLKFLSDQETCLFSPMEYMQKLKILVYSWSNWCN